MTQKTTWQIEAEATAHAVAELKAIRPDLNGKEVLALAQMVARTASSETTRGLREAGYLKEAGASASSTSSAKPEDMMGTLIETVGPLVDTAKTVLDQFRRR